MPDGPAEVGGQVCYYFFAGMPPRIKFCHDCCQVSLGDTLVSVDGKDVTGLDDAMLAKLIIGPAGTKVCRLC